MNMKEDEKWQSLLSLSQPTFSVEPTLPYGLMTRTLAQLAAEKRQEAMVERIGFRALFASLVVLAVTAGLAYHAQRAVHIDLDSGVPGLLRMEKLPLS